MGGSVVGAETSSAAVIVGIGSEFSAVSRVGTAGAMSGTVGSSGVGVGVCPSNSLIISMSIGGCSHTLYVPYGFSHTVHRFGTGLACFQFSVFGAKMSSTIPDRRTISTTRLVVLAVVLCFAP